MDLDWQMAIDRFPFFPFPSMEKNGIPQPIHLKLILIHHNHRNPLTTSRTPNNPPRRHKYRRQYRNKHKAENASSERRGFLFLFMKCFHVVMGSDFIVVGVVAGGGRQDHEVVGSG